MNVTNWITRVGATAAIVGALAFGYNINTAGADDGRTVGAHEAEPGQNCKPSGAPCEQSYECCSGACHTRSPVNTCD